MNLVGNRAEKGPGATAGGSWAAAGPRGRKTVLEVRGRGPNAYEAAVLGPCQPQHRGHGTQGAWAPGWKTPQALLTLTGLAILKPF